MTEKMHFGSHPIKRPRSFGTPAGHSQIAFLGSLAISMLLWYGIQTQAATYVFSCIHASTKFQPHSIARDATSSHSQTP